ncbi:17825_t:CDS:2, partial [Cetraspora pellucida]
SEDIKLEKPHQRRTQIVRIFNSALNNTLIDKHEAFPIERSEDIKLEKPHQRRTQIVRIFNSALNNALIDKHEAFSIESTVPNTVANDVVFHDNNTMATTFAIVLYAS